MPDLDAILKATDVLTTLSVADTRVLLQYEGKLANALQALQRTVEAVRAVRIESARPDGTASPSFSNPASSLQPAEIAAGYGTHSGSPTSSPSDSDDQSTNYDTNGIETDISSHDKSSKLCSFLNDKERSAAIQKYLSSTPDFSRICTWKNGDPRITELSICSSPGNSYNTCLRRGLSQRSLAIEFDQWERATFDQSRVLKISQKLELSLQRDGHIDKFIKAKEFKNDETGTAKKGICHGLRWLVFESIYGHDGVSLVLMLVYSRFRGVPYEEFLQLKNSLQDWEKFAIEKSPVLEQWQGYYEGHLWSQLPNWQPTCGRAKRQRTSRAGPAHYQSPTSRRGSTPNTTMAERHHEGEFEETQASLDQPPSNTSTLSQDARRIPRERDHLFPVQPTDYPSDIAPQTDTISAVLDLPCLENFDPFLDLPCLENFDPFLDLPCLENSNPLQDIELFQDFNPFWDINISDFDSVFPQVSAEENNNSPVNHEINDREQVIEFGAERDRHTTFLSSLSHRWNPQIVC